MLKTQKKKKNRGRKKKKESKFYFLDLLEISGQVKVSFFGMNPLSKKKKNSEVNLIFKNLSRFTRFIKLGRINGFFSMKFYCIFVIMIFC